MTIYDEPAVTTAPPYGTINPGEYSFDEGDITGQVRSNYEEIRQIQAYLSNQQQDISGLSSLSVDWASIGDLYVPDALSTPRVQITTAPHGGFAILGSGDTYDDSTGTGTYEVLFDYAAATPGLYFADGAAYIGSAGITISGAGKLNITSTTTDSSITKVVDVTTTIANTIGSPSVAGISVALSKSTTAGFSILYGGVFNATVDANATGTNVRGLQVTTGASSGTVTTNTGVHAALTYAAATITDARGFNVEMSRISGTVTTGVGFRVGTLVGTNQRAISIEDPAAGANNYALYSSASAQSVHAGNFRIGSVVNPTVALDVTGAALVSSTLGVTGATTLSSTLKVSGATSLGGTHTATGILDIRDTNVIIQALAPFPAIVTGTNNGGALYFGLNATGSTIPTAAIETSWGGATNPQIGIGVIRDALKANLLMDYNGDTFIRNGSTNSVVVYRNGQVGIGVTNTTAGRLLWGQYGTAATTADFRWEHTDNTSGSSHALHSIIVGGASSGDPFINFRVAGATDWSMGIDNSVANDPFVLARSTALGTTNILSFLAGSVTLADPYDVVLGSTTGTKIGTATTQKLGFYNATPIVRPSAYTQTYSTADKTHATDGSADFPAGGVGTAAGGWSTAANRDLAITRFNALRVTVTDLKQLVNSIIDDLQALGLVG